jgi:succinyl-CoA synthetase alpha subunit
MVILVDRNTRVIVQGVTGRSGEAQTKAMLEYGTNVVGGVSPGKGGMEVHGVPVFDTMVEAVEKTSANASLVLVPSHFVKDAAFEAISADVNLLVITSDHVPLHDAAKIKCLADRKGTVIVGPNTPGIVSPGKSKVGIYANNIFSLSGPVGIVTRSGTASYEVAGCFALDGIGLSTVVGIGGDPITGTSMTNILRMFQHDYETKAIVLMGEIGGTAEEDAAEFIKDYVEKPVAGYIVGRVAPHGKRMGHAGAIVQGERGTAQSKIEALRDAGVNVASKPSELVEIMRKILSQLDERKTR